MNTLIMIFSIFNANICNGVDTIDIISSNAVLTKVVGVFAEKRFLDDRTSLVVYVDSSLYHWDKPITRSVGRYSFTFKRYNGTVKSGDIFVSYYNAFDGLRCSYEIKEASDLKLSMSVSCANDVIEVSGVEILESVE